MADTFVTSGFLQLVKLVDNGDTTYSLAISAPAGAALLGKTEDSPHVTGDLGVMTLGVRQDAAAALAGTSGDYIPLIVDANGKLWVSATYLEDTAHASGDEGTQVLAVRQDTAAALAGTTGDYIPLTTDALGKLWTAGTHLEDAAHGTGDTGVQVLAVRQDTPAALAGTDGDYIPLTTDSSGFVYVQARQSTHDNLNANANIQVGNADVGTANPVPVAGTAADGAAVAGNPVRVAGKDGAGNTQDILTDTDGNLQVDVLTSSGQYAEDTAHNTGDIGTQVLAVRKDTAAALAGLDGDYAPMEVDASGRLHVNAQQPTHDSLLANVTIQVADTDVGTANPVPVAGTAADGAAAAGNPVQVGGKDGAGNIQAVTTDTDGHLQVDVLSIAAGDNNIGNVDLASAIPAGAAIIGKVGIDQTTPGTTNRVDIGAALPAGNNNIGDVDVASIAAGDNNIGNVDIVSLPAGNLGQQLMAASVSTVPASNITDTTYIGDIKFGEALPAGAAIIGQVGIDQTTDGTTNKVRAFQPTHDSLQANANLQVADTDVSTSNPVPIGGAAADDAAAAGNPVCIGALADETSPDSVDEGDVGRLRMTLDRLLRTTDSRSAGAAASHRTPTAIDGKYPPLNSDASWTANPGGRSKCRFYTDLVVRATTGLTDAPVITFRPYTRNGGSGGYVGAGETVDYTRPTLSDKATIKLQKTTDVGASYTDYSASVIDNNAATQADLDGLGTVANGDWFVIGGPVPFIGAALDMDAANVNAIASVLSVEVWSNGAWAAASNVTDGSASGGATLAQDGQITWDMPADWDSVAINGITAYWARLSVSAAISANVDVEECDLLMPLRASIDVQADGDDAYLMLESVTGGTGTLAYSGTIYATWR